MNNKANKIIYGFLGLIIYIAFMVGIGFILNLFWKIPSNSETMYWVVTGIVCLLVTFYVLLLMFGNKDRGVGAIQLVFSLGFSFLPLLVRLINMIPNAGIYISIVLVFVIGVLYLISMVSMGYYANDVNNKSDNRPGGKEI